MRQTFLLAFVRPFCIAGLMAFGACSESTPEPAPVIDPVDTTHTEPADTLKPTRSALHYPSLVSVDGRFNLTSEQKECIRRNNDFSLRLLANIRQQQRSEKAETPFSGLSTVFSPLSLSIALAFAADGASGNTATEIWNTTGFAASTSVNELCATIIQNTLQADSTTRFNIANAFYLNSLKGYTMKDDYIYRLHGYYDADIETLDFSDVASLQRINDWGKRQTDGMIPNVLQELSVSAVAYLLNAIFMEAGWVHQFSEVATLTDDFTNAAGKIQQLPLMHQTGSLPYVETAEYQALRMHYGNNTFGMTIILPKDGKTIDNVLASLTPEALDAIAQQRNHVLINLTLPRFTSDVTTDLIDILKTMGIHQAFDPQLACFDGIVNETSLCISEIFQKARIEVAEKGTRAAAITVIGMEKGSIGEPVVEPVPIPFTANRPFLYFITERTTGTIYFMGVYDG